ncbi:MAG: ribonuclease P protein component [Eubacteriaceae bacterium]|jgi:ribonuclease P protein component
MFSSLKSKTDFDNVYENGKIFGNRNFTLRYVKNRKNANRLGIVVSKKVSNRAVHRNKIRRQVREAYRNSESTVKQGYDLIITAKPSCLGEEYSVLSKSIQHLFYKQGLLDRNQKS